jgi:GNAT superfamily N-acetyltransferase
MTIREATIADLDHLVTMALHFLESTKYGQLFPPDRARLTTLARTCLAQGVIVVAEDRGGDLVGMIAVAAMTSHPWSARAYAEEQAWWIEPAYRSGTLGPRLLNYVHEWARLQGLAFVKMGEPVDAPGVGAFYARLGYRVVETAWVKEL